MELENRSHGRGGEGIAGLPDCRIAGLPDCRIAGLPDCRIAGLPDCRIARPPRLSEGLSVTGVDVRG
jgi:hypothetical protein